jgi:hypothetical protein
LGKRRDTLWENSGTNSSKKEGDEADLQTISKVFRVSQEIKSVTADIENSMLVSSIGTIIEHQLAEERRDSS